MNNVRQSSTATTIGVGFLAGLVVFLGCMVTIWLVVPVEAAKRENSAFLMGTWLMPALWVAVSAGAASFSSGASGWTALRATLLGLFGWVGMLLGNVLFASLVLHPILQRIGVPPDFYWVPSGPGLWQWIYWACPGALGGACLGVIVAERESKKTPEKPRGFINWGKVSTWCGTLGFVLFLLVLTSRERSAEGGFYLRLFIMFPAGLLSTVAVVVGLWTRKNSGWILGLLGFACLLVKMLLVPV